MEKLLAFLPTLFAFIGRAQSEVPAIVGAIGTLIGAVKDLLPHTAPQSLDVKWLQTTLKALGFDPGPIDGIYGNMTKAAVTAYQTARNLVADGWAGVATTAALLAEKK